MEILYKLRPSEKSSDRKYSAKRMKEYLIKEEFKQLNFDEKELTFYKPLSKEINLLNDEMFKPDSDFHKILWVLHDIRKKYSSAPLHTHLKESLEGSLLPKEAYCFYKLKSLNEAENLTQKCLQLNRALIDIGFKSLELNSIEQNINLSRVYFTMNKQEHCSRIWAGVFEYLLLGSTEKLMALPSISTSDNTLLHILREYSALDYLNVFVSSYFRNPQYEALDVAVIFKPWYKYIELSTSERLAIYNWIELKLLYQTMEADDFAQELVIFFEDNSTRNYDFLKLSLLFDFIKLLADTKLSPSSLENYLNFLNSFVSNQFSVEQYIKDLFQEKIEKLLSTALSS